jgi:hypothetical protein
VKIILMPRNLKAAETGTPGAARQIRNPCSAGFQPAVSPISNRQGVGKQPVHRRIRTVRRLEALRYSRFGNLRYCAGWTNVKSSPLANKLAITAQDGIVWRATHWHCDARLRLSGDPANM